ncbi:ABC transporter ATP-binding protein [Mycoplasmopsis cynos]|nr:ABC transporter ATP-binding protein [Mycoplasmopsis cynos]UWV93184.1 ABC transporter ATP-binding protein [Mycoplasmopsis cynos]
MLLDFILNPFKLWRIKKLFVKSTIYKSLEDVGLLKQFAYRYPHEFSGGQRQRIVIARALITQPKVIVADEPIASLDISIQAQVVNLLKDLCEQKNIGMIFIAHDLSMIEYIADRVQIMHLGKVVESGDTIQIYKNPLHPYTINLFKAIPKISNANEKFKDVKFELEYMKDQQYPNIPNVYAVSSEKNHFIYATAKQFNKWVNKEDDK